jgi:hypothetical protein
MKTKELLGSKGILFGFIAVLIYFISLNVSAQNGIEISLAAHPGYTLVNFEKALDYSDDFMSDWDQFSYGGSLTGLFAVEKPLSYGIEIGWQRLYYAYYIVPMGYYSAYREFNVSTISIMAVGRYSPQHKFFALAGAGIHKFNNGVSPAIYIEPGYLISLGEKLKIPVSVRLNPVFGKGLPATISFGIGVSYRLK